jgi:hypothetical protein
MISTHRVGTVSRRGHARLSSDKVDTLLNTGVYNTGSSGSKAIITTQLLAVNLQAGVSLFQPHSETTTVLW